MKKIISTSSEGYSIIAAIMMIGFLLILTTSTLNLVLQEMQDGKGRQDYLKAYAGAEWSMELALLKIKDKWYWYYGELIDSQMLWNTHKDWRLSYEFDAKVQTYAWTLEKFETDIIPLFWIDDAGLKHSIIGWMSFTDSSPLNNIVWNIIGADKWMSWQGTFTQATTPWVKTLDGTGDFIISHSETVWSLFTPSSENYLIVYNSTSSSLGYSFWVSWTNFFTKPRATISSTAKVWKYSQNLETLVDNTEFLWILKYSIYSWD